MKNPMSSIVVINQFNSEHYILIKNGIQYKTEPLFLYGPNKSETYSLHIY